LGQVICCLNHNRSSILEASCQWTSTNQSSTHSRCEQNSRRNIAGLFCASELKEPGLFETSVGVPSGYERRFEKYSQSANPRETDGKIDEHDRCLRFFLYNISCTKIMVNTSKTGLTPNIPSTGGKCVPSWLSILWMAEFRDHHRKDGWKPINHGLNCSTTYQLVQDFATIHYVSSKFGCWCNDHLEKYEFVNGKDDIPYMKWKITFMVETTNQKSSTKHTDFPSSFDQNPLAASLLRCPGGLGPGRYAGQQEISHWKRWHLWNCEEYHQGKAICYWNTLW